MAKVVLKVHYSRYCINVVVDDTDRSLLMDVINDVLDAAKKHDLPLPANPSLSYTYNYRSYKLLDDNALMEMFSRFEGKSELHIWIGDDDNPSHVVSLAKNLKASQHVAAETTRFVREKLQIRGSSKQMGLTPSNPLPFVTETNVIEDLTENPQAESVTPPNPIPSQTESVNPRIPTENPTATQSTFVSSSLSPRRSPRLTKKQPTPSQTTHNIGEPSQTNQNPQVSSKSTQKTVVPSQRSSKKKVSEARYKMPKATAKKRGLFVPKSSEPVQVAGRRSARLSSNRMAPEMETLNQSESESDESFEPSGDEEVDDEADMTDLEEEDYTTITSLEFIDDGYNINPMPDIHQWPEFDVPTLEPPTMKRSIGRPSRNRRREQGEKRKGKRSVTVKCTKCNCFGHNAKTCKGGYTAKEKDEMQGKILKSKSKKRLTEDSYFSPYPSLRALESEILASSQASEIGSSSNQQQQKGAKKTKGN